MVGLARPHQSKCSLIIRSYSHYPFFFVFCVCVSAVKTTEAICRCMTAERASHEGTCGQSSFVYQGLAPSSQSPDTEDIPLPRTLIGKWAPDDGVLSTEEEKKEQPKMLALTTRTGTIVWVPYTDEVSLGDVASRLSEIKACGVYRLHEDGCLACGEHVFSHTEFGKTVDEVLVNVESGNSSPVFRWINGTALSLGKTDGEDKGWTVTRRKTYLLQTLNGLSLIHI